MERTTTSTKSNFSERITDSRQECQKTLEISCNRKMQNHKISKPPVLNSKKRFVRRKVYSRPINTKQVYQVPIFQNADYESNSFTTTKTFLDSIPRSERWILAHTHNSPKTTLSRVYLRRPKLPLQGLALRLKYRTADIHKTDSPCSPCDGVKRHLVPTLFGRYPHNQLYTRGMLPTRKTGNCNFEILRLDPKRKEVSVGTSTNIRLAGSTLQPSQSHCAGHKRENRVTPRTSNINSKLKILLKKKNYESSRTSQLDRSVRSSNTSSNVKDKSFITIFQKPTYRCKDSPIKRNEVKSSQMDLFTNDLSTSGKSNTNLHHSNRCFIKRLGISDQPKILQRRLRSHSKMVNQHLRITDSLVCPIENKSETCSDPGTMRQFNSSGGSQTRYVHSFSPSDDFGNHLETSNQPRLEPINISYPGSLQCSGRSTFQKHYPVNRMVIAPKGFSTPYTQGEQPSSSRSFCNEFKSPIKNLHLSLSGPDGNSSGYYDCQLGRVGSPVSVPPNQHDFQGFTETPTNKFQNSCTDNARNTNTTLVHGLTAAEDTIEDDTDTASTDSVEQVNESNQTYQTSRLEVIKAAYNKKFPDCDAAVSLMAAPLRKTSINDYQHKWKSFLSFLSKREIPFEKVTVGTVLQFFMFLFRERHLKPSTVAHYRTALTVPLKEHYNIDLKVTEVADLIRGMWIERPNKPVSAPAWSLNKVLDFIEKLDDQPGETMLFRKTAFLLLLATGWRVSELHACVRNREFCWFSENSSLHIRPHPSFLAKNECSQRRWVHKEIKVLKLGDGSISKLCPVTTLKNYLNFSSDRTSGDLLLTPGDHQKKLSIFQLSKQICSLIFQADKTTERNVHDIRSYATSCALAETMLVGDLVSAINWSSPAVFYKFYLTQTEPLTRPVSLPVQRN